jgi:hypothetical protein
VSPTEGARGAGLPGWIEITAAAIFAVVMITLWLGRPGP